MKTYILIGAPGSGKTTWGKKFVKDNAWVVRICPDEYRAKLGTGEEDQSVSYQAFLATYAEMEQTLIMGKDVLIDATNMHKKRRKEFIDIARKWHSDTIAVVFEATRETLLERIAKRVAEGGRNVSAEVVDMMLAKYQRPDELEFDEIIFITKV